MSVRVRLYDYFVWSGHDTMITYIHGTSTLKGGSGRISCIEYRR